MNWKNILERAAWTFLEGFLGGLVISVEMDGAIVLAAVCAGLSALKTFLVEVAKSKTGS